MKRDDGIVRLILGKGAGRRGGTCFDEAGRAVALEGESLVRHHPDAWLLESSMKLLLPEAVTISNRYEIVPFRGDSTRWTSENPGLGTLRGKFTVISEVILSSFATVGGRFSGHECLICGRTGPI